ncbi:peptide-methionine (R)-S-oxide reductase MsrB [Patescibacteria group bacterium]|nr:peptide-methionine (R)-S-oxide reductase MsrB [Patescibacteria group bacterium]
MRFDKLKKEEMKKKLSPELYKIAVEKGTEAPFSGKYVFTKDNGVYKCLVCGNPLFSSDTKFESNTGWPSFYDPINPDSVKYHEDKSMGVGRTEITCGKCGSHLGHVFDDGPKPTGKRYCINCVSLDLKKEK